MRLSAFGSRLSALFKQPTADCRKLIAESPKTKFLLKKG